MLRQIDHAERAARGAARLDERYGPGWITRVRLADLDVGSPTACMLKQVAGGYHAGLTELKILSSVAVGFGFAASQDDLVGGGSALGYFRALTAAWRDLVVERRLTSRDAAASIREAVTA